MFAEKPTPVNIITKPINVCSQPPNADRIITRKVQFKITQDEFGIYWISITPRYYENLSINMEEIIQYIKQKNAIVKYYQQCQHEMSSADKKNKTTK